MNKRIDYIDSAKGILILLVVLGHILNNNRFICNWIWSFHMPAFFIITGILINYSSFQHTTFLSLCIKKFRSLIIPFTFFEAIGALLNRLLHGYTLNIKGYIYNTITGNYNNIVNWFLFTLFFAEILVWITLKIVSKKNSIIFTTCIFFILGFLNFTSSFCRILLASAFILTGFLFDSFLAHSNFLHVIGLLICSIVGTLLNGRVDMCEMSFGNIILFLLCSFIGTSFILSISRFYIKIKESKLIDYCGKHSLIIMGIHVPLIMLIQNLLATL